MYRPPFRPRRLPPPLILDASACTDHVICLTHQPRETTDMPPAKKKAPVKSADKALVKQVADEVRVQLEAEQPSLPPGVVGAVPAGDRGFSAKGFGQNIEKAAKLAIEIAGIAADGTVSPSEMMWIVGGVADFVKSLKKPRPAPDGTTPAVPA